MIDLAVATLAFGLAAPGQPAAPDEEIVVRGAPEAVAPTGSRVPRAEAPVGYSSVSTGTGVGGLTPGSGMDPFAGPMRNVTETSCISDDPSLSADSACRLAPIQRLVAGRAWGEARRDRSASCRRHGDRPGALSRSAFSLPDRRRDRHHALREQALDRMLETAAMPQAERPPALRTLVAFSLQRGDRVEAARRLEQLVALDGEDSRSRGNLAALYSEAGRPADALALLREAIAIAGRRGEPVPPEWLSFAGPD